MCLCVEEGAAEDGHDGSPLLNCDYVPGTLLTPYTDYEMWYCLLKHSLLEIIYNPSNSRLSGPERWLIRLRAPDVLTEDPKFDSWYPHRETHNCL